jgi:hypothetical protein
MCGSDFHSLLKGLDANLLLPLASLRDVVGRLHTHKRIHLDAESFFDPERHIAGKIRFAVERLESAGRETRRTVAAAVTESPAGSMISVRTKSPGWGGFFMGMSLCTISP